MIKIGDYEITRIEEGLLVEQPTTFEWPSMSWRNSDMQKTTKQPFTNREG